MTQKKWNRKSLGFTLIEMLLVMVIITAIIVLGLGYLQQRAEQLRIDRASTQMQQILNAGLSYYISNNSWPVDLACLQGSGGTLCGVAYLPANLNSPWGGTYQVSSYAGSPSPLLFVSTTIPTKNAFAIASTLVGRLPLAYASSGSGPLPPNDNSCVANSTSCTVVASVNIPGQNLNNARSVNFSGLYHNGACVPQPICPVDANGTTMIPQIIVVPVSVHGINYQPTGIGTANCNETNQTGCQTQVFPISSFTAYATNLGAPPPSCGATGTTPQSEACYADYTKATTLSGTFWRVCLSTTTEKGVVAPTNTTWGELQGTILAITRCVPNNESPGSGFTVWSPN